MAMDVQNVDKLNNVMSIAMAQILRESWAHITSSFQYYSFSMHIGGKS